MSHDACAQTRQFQPASATRTCVLLNAKVLKFPLPMESDEFGSEMDVVSSPVNPAVRACDYGSRHRALNDLQEAKADRPMQEKKSRALFVRIFEYLTKSWKTSSVVAVAATPQAVVVADAATTPVVEITPAEHAPGAVDTVSVAEALLVPAVISEVERLEDAGNDDSNIVVLATAHQASSQSEFHLAQRLLSVDRLNKPSSRSAKRSGRLAPAGKPIPKSSGGKRMSSGSAPHTGRIVGARGALSRELPTVASAKILPFPRQVAMPETVAA
ncbi:MAG: hypothetical protein NW217_09075 [Hyphomicrobiaceae bacterium]|nr:hypothetical protein [Hyphomicrobiaceae bacterium]